MTVGKSHMKPPRIARRGYTLLELIITVPLLAMLLAGMAAAVGLASKAMPAGNTHTSAPLAAAAACDALASELSYATAIASRSATSIQFNCADRNGDGTNEIIQYAWSGAGTAWTRTLNGGTPETLVPSVQQFSLTYNTRTDIASGLLYLQSVDVNIISPSNTARPLTFRLFCRNEPQLP